MFIRLRSTRKVALVSVFALAALMALGCFQSFPADETKDEKTPFFCQHDKAAGFAGDGGNYCAPVSIADGLVYLATERGFDDLVENSDHDGQVELVKNLAKAMHTDPKSGTDPDRILTGLVDFIKNRGYVIKRLEIVTARSVTERNKKYLIGTKPDLKWMTAAAENPDVVEVFNFGWYLTRVATYEDGLQSPVERTNSPTGDQNGRYHNHDVLFLRPVLERQRLSG